MLLKSSDCARRSLWLIQKLLKFLRNPKLLLLGNALSNFLHILNLVFFLMDFL